MLVRCQSIRFGRYESWMACSIGLGAILLLLGLARNASAGPPQSDLPDVKMPSLRADRPRLIFRPDGSDWPWTFEKLRQRYQTHDRFRKLLKPWLDEPVSKDPSPAASALRYRLTGDEAAARQAIEKLQTRTMEKIGHEYYSDGWEYSLAYDWLYDHPDITDEKRRTIEGFLVANARRALDLLNDESWDLEPSLWHGRTKIANLAMVVALTLQTSPEADALRAQLVRFFGDACRALRISEGWPEGYAYWLGNRSFPFALAVDCWRTATGASTAAGVDLVEMLRRTGMWHVYGMRPDNKFLLYGDVFQGVLIDYGYRAQTMDYYARITRDPYLQAFALHGHANSDTPYFRRTRWVAALAFDPDVHLPKGSTPKDPFAALNALPGAELFGPGAYNLAVFRTGWQADSTMISFRAGASQVHHAHYNAGTFTVYKDAPLAILSGGYFGFGSEHRENYYVRSVAANCPLVLMPGERLATRRHYDHPTASTGGQRITIPTGSDVASTAEWRRLSQPGQAYAGGQVVGFDHQPNVFGYVAADLTAAYNSTLFSWPEQKPKIRRALRGLLYLLGRQTLLVYDRITATSRDYQKKWLLHTIEKPACSDTTVLKGEQDDGILATTARDLQVTSGNGAMTVRALLPEPSRWLLIGGPSHRFYVEDDGDQSDGFDGRNAVGGMKERSRRSYFDLGNWRAELEPAKAAESHDFLVAMCLGREGGHVVAGVELVGRGPDYAACQVGETIVVFADVTKLAGPALVEVVPTQGAAQIIACALTEPQPIGVTQFGTVAPPRCTATFRPKVPLPAGRSARFVVDATKLNRMTISLDDAALGH